MPPILLFHCVLGLRQLERGLADEWRKDDHEVILPDLYEGRTAESYDDGFAIMNDIGLDGLRERAAKAVQAAPEDSVLAGISLGGAMAAHVWRSRPETRGVLFLAGPGDWPGDHAKGTPVQMHAARPDPFDDEEVFTGWQAKDPGADLECFRYDGVGHLFLDRSLSDFNADAAAVCRSRCRKFLADL